MEPTMQPAPSQEKIKTTPKDFFLNLGSIVALYVLVGGFTTFAFSLINKLFPDALRTYSYINDMYASGIKVGLSIIIVAFPLHAYLSKIIFNDLYAHVEKRALALRKWLIYFTLFITGLAIAIDVIVLLNYLLDGEITARFVLKVFTVLATAGVIFWYYIQDLRGTFYEKPKLRAIFVWIISALMLVSVIMGFTAIGSPSKQRQLKADEQRVSDLQSIQWQVVSYYQRSGKLPNTTNQIADPIQNYIVPVDPLTGSPYPYIVRTGATTSPQFDICATFTFPSTNTEDINASYTKPLDANENWKHDAGRTCFTRTIDPVLYPVTTNPKQ